MDRTMKFLLGLVSIIPIAAIAAPVVLPNTFANGTVADANEVNANFDALANAINSSEIYETTDFLNFLQNQTATLTALCDSGDIVLGGAARGEDITISSEGRYAQSPGIYSIGPQGWTATATSGTNGGAQFMTVHAVCVKL